MVDCGGLIEEASRVEKSLVSDWSDGVGLIHYWISSSVLSHDLGSELHLLRSRKARTGWRELSVRNAAR